MGAMPQRSVQRAQPNRRVTTWGVTRGVTRTPYEMATADSDEPCFENRFNWLTTGSRAQGCDSFREPTPRRRCWGCCEVSSRDVCCRPYVL
jgi:hypothetical protein